ncbi:hypothetical protein ACQY1Q_17290, partial [Tenacibaculum sp. TC6]
VPTVLDINLNDILTPEQLLFLSQYPDLKGVLEVFLRANNNSLEAQGFVKQAIKALTNGGEVDFDDRIINKLTGKALCVYNKLQAMSTNFKSMIKKFDGEFPVSHLKFEESTSLSSNTNAETSPPSNYLITITLNSNNLDRSILSIARTIIHETIHAEMFRKLLSEWQHPSLEGIDENFLINIRNNFPGLTDYYIRWLNNTPTGINTSSAQHQAMAQHYRNTIKEILIKFDSKQNNDVYEALSWVGLKGTIAWNNLSQSEKDKIEQVLKDFENNNKTNCE